MTQETLNFVCHSCGGRYHALDDGSLTDGATSACPKCGTHFVFFVLPGDDPREARAAAGGVRPGPRTGQSPARATGSSLGSVRPFLFHGSGMSLFGIHIINVFLTLVTLGVYYFWAKVRTRAYLLSQMEFEGDRFAFHGTGKEMLKGFAKALVVFGIPYLIIQLVPDLVGPTATIKTVVSLLSGVILLVFIPFSIISARRYRFSRTSWRGIRLSVRGRALDFIKLFISGWFLTVITLGAYYPYFETRMQQFLISHSHVGNQRLEFDGHGGDLAKSFLVAYLLLPFTLGFSWIWYMAKRQRYFWDHTTFVAARFRSTITAWGLLRLKVVNLALLIITLGLAWPWVVIRNVRFILTHLSLEGPVELQGLRQEHQAVTATGEGLADWLDTGFEFG